MNPKLFESIVSGRVARLLSTHVVAGNAVDHTRIMTQHLKGIFNWELEQLVAQQEYFKPSHNQTGNGSLSPDHLHTSEAQHFVRNKKNELETLIKKKISSLVNEQVTFVIVY